MLLLERLARCFTTAMSTFFVAVIPPVAFERFSRNPADLVDDREISSAATSQSILERSKHPTEIKAVSPPRYQCYNVTCFRPYMSVYGLLRVHTI